MRILEQGFTEFAGLDGRPVVSVGVVVENTSRFTAEGVQVTLQLVDASGAAIGSSATTDQSISLLRPGRFGIGATAVPRESGVSDVQVRLSAPSRWWPDDGLRPLADLTADDVTAQYHDRPSHGDVPAISVAFTVTSGYRAVDDPVAYAVFRNAAGDVVGGSDHTESRLSAVGLGASEGEIHVREPIPDIDGSQTEVFVDVGP